MPINPKPFNAAQKIFKTVFGDRPQIFSAEDLDREVDNIHNMLLQLSLQVGPMRENWQVNQVLISDTYTGIPNITFSSEINIVKINNSEPAYVFYQGIQFDISEVIGTQIPYSGVFSTVAPALPVVYLVLIATSQEITFALNPALCGLNSTEFPTTVPAADVVQFSNERLVYTDNPAGIVLGNDEQIICIIATIAKQDVSYVTNPADTVDFQLTPQFNTIVRYNAALPSDLMANLTFQQGDQMMEDLGVAGGTPLTPQASVGPNGMLTNGTQTDAWLILNEYVQRKNHYMDNAWEIISIRMDLSTAAVEVLQTAIAALQSQLGTLTSAGSTTIPVNSIIPYYGSLANFDATGKGSPGTPVQNFVICNGNNSSPNLFGRYLVGAIAGIPNTGAPALLPEVDPTNTTWGNTNPNYTLGAKGGEPGHALQTGEGPAHDHAAHGAGPISDGGNDYFVGRTNSTYNYTKSGSTPTLFGGSPEVDTNMRTSATGVAVAHNNLPPYFAVVYLMRFQ